MTTSLNLDPRARLEDVLDLPLGTVVADNQGVDHVFIGKRPNTAGHELLFMPHAGTKLMNPASYALVEGGLRKFPGLARFVRGAPAFSQHAGTAQSVEQINAILEPETGLRVEHADSPGGPFLRLQRKTGSTWESKVTVGVFPPDVGAGTLVCVGSVARHFYNLGRDSTKPSDNRDLKVISKAMESTFGLRVYPNTHAGTPVAQIVRKKGAGWDTPHVFVANFPRDTPLAVFLAAGEVAKHFIGLNPKHIAAAKKPRGRTRSGSSS